MKKNDEMYQNNYNSNYSFTGCNDDKSLKELLPHSLISDIDQSELSKANFHEFNNSLKRDVSFSSQYECLNKNLNPNLNINQGNDNQIRLHHPFIGKFKSDNNLGNSRIPIFNDFHQNNYFNYKNNPSTNYNNNWNNNNNSSNFNMINNNNIGNSFQNNFNHNFCSQTPNMGYYNNNQVIGKNLVYNGNQMTPYFVNNNINNIGSIGNMANMGNIGNVGNIQNSPYNYPNNINNPNLFQNNNFTTPYQVFDNPKVSNNPNMLNGNLNKLQKGSKSSMDTSPILSTNVSTIEEGLNNFHFSRPQRKLLSAGPISTNMKQQSKRKNSGNADDDRKSNMNDDYSDIHEILACLDTKLADYIRTQKGSRNMQKLLNKITPDKLDIILNEIGDSLPELMVDPYSNYFCQKLAQCCSSEQRIFFLRKIQNDFTNISCNKKGTYALQGIIDIINLEDEMQIIRESIENTIIFLCLDNNGTHVIQKLISCIEEEKRDYINDQIIQNLLKLVLDANGICIAKSFIAGNSSVEIRKKTLEAIIANCLEILQNPFGNYVIQEVFEKWGFETCKEIVKIIHQNIISLSMQKYSSNVVEKSIEIADSNLRKKVLKDLLGSNKITSVLKNKFGNFVLQKAISFIKLDENLKNEIKDNISKKLNISNNKDKVKLTTLLEML